MSQGIGKRRLSFPGEQCLPARGLVPKMDFVTARTNSSGAVGCFLWEGDDGARLTESGELQWAKSAKPCPDACPHAREWWQSLIRGRVEGNKKS